MTVNEWECNSIRNNDSNICTLYTVDCFPNYIDIHERESRGSVSAKDAVLISEITLLEPSIADAIKAIEAATDLPAGKRVHWACSLRQTCVYLNKPPETVPARWKAICIAVHALHHARVGATPKTLANHKSNARAALLWFANAENFSKVGIPLLPAWAALSAKIKDRHRYERLSGFLRFCSGKRLGPDKVSEEALGQYMLYRAQTTALATNDAARRKIARAWNACVDDVHGWPRRRLIEPPVKALTTMPWENFPEALRREIEKYLAGVCQDPPRRQGQAHQALQSLNRPNASA